MSLSGEIEVFFNPTRKQPSRNLAVYEKVGLRLRISGKAAQKKTTDEIQLTFLNGRLDKIQSGSPKETGLYDVPFEGQYDTWRKVFVEKELTLGEALYSARAFAPEEKAKHNLVVAICQTIRELQGK